MLISGPPKIDHAASQPVHLNGICYHVKLSSSRTRIGRPPSDDEFLLFNLSLTLLRMSTSNNNHLCIQFCLFWHALKIFASVRLTSSETEREREGKTDDHRYRHQNGRERALQCDWEEWRKKKMRGLKIHFSSFQNGRWHGLIVPNHRPQTQAIQWKSDVDDQKASNQHFSWFRIRFCAKWNLMVFHSKIVFLSLAHFIFGSADLCQLKCFRLNLSVERNSDWHDDIFFCE